MNETTVESLWENAGQPEPGACSIVPEQLPEPAVRYLDHALAGRDRLPSAVRLRMHGHIRIGAWRPFTAEQVIVPGRGMVWRAEARFLGLPVRGHDRVVDGRGEMRWKLLGRIPVVTAEGDDVTRSARGRMAGEAVWLPTMLCPPHGKWTAVDEHRARVEVSVDGTPVDLELTVGPGGELKRIRYERWGNPDRKRYREVSFGGIVEEERTFDGVTIPSRLRLGWYFDEERFEHEGEFFRVEIDAAAYR